MYGEVYVPYTPIGGSNMSRMSNDTGLSGSSGYTTEDGTAIGTHVSWKLPGGIVSKQNWGYLFDTNKTYFDDDVNTHIAELGLDEMQATQQINQWVYDYVHQVLTADKDNLFYDWENFKATYTGCIAVDGVRL